MSPLIQLLEDRHDRFIAAVTGSSDPKELAELGQAWLTSEDPWATEQLDQYVARALDCRGHEGLVRQALRCAEESRNHSLMSALFVAFDRSVRRRRVVQPTEHLTCTRRPKALYSLKTLGWFRRRIWSYFRQLSEQDSAAYVESAVQTMQQYHDNDFASGESILDNRSLMKMCFHDSPLIAIGPVHASLTPGHSINDLAPAPWRPTSWTDTNARRRLIDLAARAQTQFIRWWAATLYCDEPSRLPGDIDDDLIVELVSRQEQFLEPLCRSLLTEKSAGFSADTWLKLIATAGPDMSATVLEAFAAVARNLQMPDTSLVDVCHGITSEHSSRFIAVVVRSLHDRRDKIKLSSDLVAFLRLALGIPGGGRLRSWIVTELLSLAQSSERETDEQVAFIARLLSTFSDPAKMEIIHELLVAQTNSPKIEGAVMKHLPQLRIDARQS